ncbi:MAG: anaerobic ribonucleoside-triphosphate reductase activating protein [Ruminococcus sp.]|nr:anaerobic ribonucleoside-triphosphate reductase activating protein [Ruminococcus sp.]
MNYGSIKKCDVANGPGVRVSLFVSGCTHHCKGCFNPETWDFNYGKEFDSSAENRILELLIPDYIEGFSLLGGEPFEPQNQPTLTLLLRKIKKRFPEKKIWCYSGYTLDKDILNKDSKIRTEYTDEMIGYIDVLVDGEFKEELKNLNIKFRGSENQRLIDVKKTLSGGSVTLIDESKLR